MGGHANWATTRKKMAGEQAGRLAIWKVVCATDFVGDRRQPWYDKKKSSIGVQLCETPGPGAGSVIAVPLEFRVEWKDCIPLFDILGRNRRRSGHYADVSRGPGVTATQLGRRAASDYLKRMRVEELTSLHVMGNICHRHLKEKWRQPWYDKGGKKIK